MYILTTVYDGVAGINQTPSFVGEGTGVALSAEDITGCGQLSDLRKRLASTDFTRHTIVSDDNVFMTPYRANIYNDIQKPIPYSQYVLTG